MLRVLVVVLVLLCVSCVMVVNAPVESLDKFEQLLRLEFKHCKPLGDEQDKAAIQELRKTLLEFIDAWRQRAIRAEKSWYWLTQ